MSQLAREAAVASPTAADATRTTSAPKRSPTSWRSHARMWHMHRSPQHTVALRGHSVPFEDDLATPGGCSYCGNSSTGWCSWATALQQRFSKPHGPSTGAANRRLGLWRTGGRLAAGDALRGHRRFRQLGTSHRRRWWRVAHGAGRATVNADWQTPIALLIASERGRRAHPKPYGRRAGRRLLVHWAIERRPPRYLCSPIYPSRPGEGGTTG